GARMPRRRSPRSAGGGGSGGDAGEVPARIPRRFRSGGSGRRSEKPTQPTLGFRHRRVIPRAVVVRRGWPDEWSVAAAVLGVAVAGRWAKARARRQHSHRTPRGGDGFVVSLELQHHTVVRADGPVAMALSNGV